MMRIGVDLGGTKIELVALSGEGSELFRKRIATPRDYQATIEAICALVDEAETQLEMTGTVGIGIPGVISPFSGLVKNANSTWLNGHPLDRDLEQRLGRKVRVANDANCFAVSEALDGAAAGKEVVFGVIIGTGCGAGIAINGRVHQGGNGIGGEWGHNPCPGYAPRSSTALSVFAASTTASKPLFREPDLSATIIGPPGRSSAQARGDGIAGAGGCRGRRGL